jgi:20S proteasome subunit alpha 5
MTLEESIKTALTILKQVMEEKLNASNVEVAVVTRTSPFQIYNKEKVEAAIQGIA